MAKRKQFRVLKQIPRATLDNMHPGTRSLLDQIKGTKGNVLACTLKGVREAKNRADSLRMARKRGQVRYKEVVRRGETLYVRVR